MVGLLTSSISWCLWLRRCSAQKEISLKKKTTCIKVKLLVVDAHSKVTKITMVKCREMLLLHRLGIPVLMGKIPKVQVFP